MAPSRRSSAVPIRRSSWEAMSSTQTRSARNAPCRTAAWATRWRLPSPSTAVCSRRSRRRRRARNPERRSATTATPPAARAASPALVVSWSTSARVTAARTAPRGWRGGGGARSLLREQRRVGGLVVVGLVLAGHRLDDDVDRHRLAHRRRPLQRDLGRGGAAGRGGGHAGLAHDRRPRPLDRHLDDHVVLVV